MRQATETALWSEGCEFESCQFLALPFLKLQKLEREVEKYLMDLSSSTVFIVSAFLGANRFRESVLRVHPFRILQRIVGDPTGHTQRKIVV